MPKNSNYSALELNKLRNNYRKWIAKQEAKRLTAYPCPECKEGITTLKPKRNQGVFDTLTTCPFCGDLHYKIVKWSGRVEVVTQKEVA